MADKLAANGCQAHAETLAMCSIPREKPLSDASDISCQPRRAESLTVDEPQRLSGCDDGDALEAVEGEQIFIAGDDEIDAGGDA